MMSGRSHTRLWTGAGRFRGSGKRLGTDEQVLEYTADEANALPDAFVKGQAAIPHHQQGRPLPVSMPLKPGCPVTGASSGPPRHSGPYFADTRVRNQAGQPWTSGAGAALSDLASRSERISPTSGIRYRSGPPISQVVPENFLVTPAVCPQARLPWSGAARGAGRSGTRRVADR